VRVHSGGPLAKKSRVTRKAILYGGVLQKREEKTVGERGSIGKHKKSGRRQRILPQREKKTEHGPQTNKGIWVKRGEGSQEIPNLGRRNSHEEAKASRIKTSTERSPAIRKRVGKRRSLPKAKRGAEIAQTEVRNAESRSLQTVRQKQGHFLKTVSTIS